MSQAAAEGTSTAQEGQQATAGTETPPAGQQAPQEPTWDGKVESLPQGVQDLIKGLRTENAQKRTTAKTAEKTAEDQANAKIAAALKALGIETGEEDPVKAAQTAAQQAAQERDSALRARTLADAELIVWRNAQALGIRPEALTDSRTFEAAILKLDPSADTFAADVKKAAQDAAATNPLLKATQVVPRSGTELAGGTGETGITQQQFDRMTVGERTALYETDRATYDRLSNRR